jgi:hypothetical protein
MRSYGNGTLKGSFRASEEVDLHMQQKQLKRLGEAWTDKQKK